MGIFKSDRIAAAAGFRTSEMTLSMVALHSMGEVMPNMTLAGFTWVAGKGT